MTFNLPWEKFRYKVLPMDFKPSSDVFNIEYDKYTRNVKGCIKSFDDVLQQVAGYSQLKSKLFNNFREKKCKSKIL